ncbi:MAG: GTP-binding protein [Candidatus Peregrinibacteria bacterium Greene0416_19]|nr:MAG: GTP-binding protein [Candidatus Peregrinibacteria bacterium Greene0416_19]
MPRLPLVAIIGRPNTGKSTLFNRMIGERRAIESPVPGTTRDHVSQKVETDDVDYLLVDTGGMGGGTDDKDFEEDVQKQSLLAVTAADAIVLTINSRDDLTVSDREVASLLRKKKQKHVPVIIAVTKVDNPDRDDEAVALGSELGIADDIFPVSATHGRGVSELEDAIIAHLKNLHFEKIRSPKSLREPQGSSEPRTAEVRSPKIAVIGKPNVGKSSLINVLMPEPERKVSPRLVSEIPGTTRDTTDTVIRHEGREYLFIDTAGLRRHAKVEEGIEQYAMLRSIQAIEQADVAVLLIDATEPVSRQDKRIVSIAVDAGKGLLLLLNKIDLLTTEKKHAKIDEIIAAFPFCRFAPLLPVSTRTREGLLKMFDYIDMIHRNRLRRIPTKELHTFLEDAVHRQPMSSLASAKHITQAEDPPPTFVLFVRDPKRIQVSQLRYLENRLRSTFGFEGTPVRWVTKRSGRE